MGRDSHTPAEIDSSVFARMPSGKNRVLVALGLGLGIPWVVLFTLGSVAAPFLVPDDMVREAVLGAIIVNLLFGLVHILAAAGIWLAFYNISGTEELSIDDERIVVSRRTLGLSVPIKLGRTSADRAFLLDTDLAPGRVAHPRVEIRSGNSAVRFGAGLTAEQARALVPRLNEFLGVGPEPEDRRDT